MLNLPSTKSLIIFCSAANNSSFTLAAQELNLTQSAISKQIIALEENLGTRLFNRLPYQVNLTKNGGRSKQGHFCASLACDTFII